MTSQRSHSFVLAMSLILVTACSTGESAQRPASEAEASETPARYLLATGTLIDAALTNTISSRDAKAGDAFTARVVEDVTNVHGWVAIPAGSLVHGTVRDVSPAPNTASTGTLTIAVSSVTVRGKTYPLNASIDSLETLHEGRGIETVDVARVAGGAAAGAIAGRVIGGNATGTIIGGVVGGAAGAVVSLAMKDMDIVLPEGSHLMLTLREQLTVMVN